MNAGTHNSTTAETILAAARLAREESRKADAARRERVLAHPDLAAKLTQPPLNYPYAWQWNGYIPPRTDPDDRASDADRPASARANTSARRAALVEIAAEAYRREEAARADTLAS